MEDNSKLSGDDRFKYIVLSLLITLQSELDAFRTCVISDLNNRVRVTSGGTLLENYHAQVEKSKDKLKSFIKKQFPEINFNKDIDDLLSSIPTDPKGD